ncbi:MAG: XrtA/PEP-CTERM system histidine kinase PrsK [Thermodesulfobacteriota bacterium]
MISLFYGLSIGVLLSGLLGFRLQTGDKRFSLSLLRVLMTLPLLAGIYYHLTFYSKIQTIPLLFFFEAVFGLTWFSTAYWLNRAVVSEGGSFNIFLIVEFLLSALILGVGYFYTRHPPAMLDDGRQLILHRSHLLFAAHFFLLLSMVVMAWRLESFWRGLSPKLRWEYKYLVAGSYLVCGAMGWAVSYRFTYHRMGFDHFRLLAALLLFSWAMMGFAVVRHRLLNRKIFVSRKVVYAFVAPMAFGIYLMVIGLLVLLMRFLHLPFPVVFLWFLAVVGLFLIGVSALSGKVRHAVKFFVSTHFYTNKYEYRDEWLAFSRLLQGSLNESEVIDALQQTLSKSLYTKSICIWIGEEDSGFRLAYPQGPSFFSENFYLLCGNHPIFNVLQSNECTYLDARTCRDEQMQMSQPFFPELGLVLFAPLAIGDQVYGIIGLGPEFTGGRYGEDDFDLLTALGTQAASALMAARMAEKLAQARQQEAWDVMSAFILHDIKNAASMLSLMRQNANHHLDEPGFREDMLETIDDALFRMAKVQNRLGDLKSDFRPIFNELELSEIIERIRDIISRKIPGLEIKFKGEMKIWLHSDPEILKQILENLLLNAYEAGASQVFIEVKMISNDHQKIEICISDNGSGIAPELLPEVLFEPFCTTKHKGSGIGLWQVKRYISILGGEIHAINGENGACFTISFKRGFLNKRNKGVEKFYTSL